MSNTTLSIDLSDKTTDDLAYKIAENREERAGAFRLVYNSYLRSALCTPNSYGMRVTPYHLLPTTEVFVAVCERIPICTATLVGDGQLGLPMESVYGREIAQRRELGFHLGEVSCLADRRHDFKRLFPVFLRISRVMAQYARQQGIHELLVAVHPRHARFYQRFMAFQPIGEKTAYPAARDNPAVALRLNFVEASQEVPDIYKKFFGESIPAEQLQPQPITPAERDYFSPMIDSSLTFPSSGVAGLPYPGSEAGSMPAPTEI